MTEAPLTPDPLPTAVFKLGGSLLEIPDLAARLTVILREALSSCRPILVIGGGSAADLVRGWEPLHALLDVSSHELAIAAMDFNARLLRTLLSRAGLTVVSDPRDHRAGSILIPEFLTELHRAEPDVPPATWDITSDSLAAWLAGRLGASRLVLLKSVDPPDDRSLATAAAVGTVDPLLASFAKGLAASWINLRRDTADEYVITHDGRDAR